MKTIVIALLAFAASCQGGPDPIRLRSERANHAVAARCAQGWFTGLPWTEHDKMLVEKALSDWDLALKADEALLQFPVAAGGAK
jgi:hypothetical protein